MHAPLQPLSKLARDVARDMAPPAGSEGEETGHKPPRRHALRRLWQRLPQSTRTEILGRVSRLVAPRPDRSPRGGFPIAIAGLFSTMSGIGEGARLAYDSLEAAGLKPTAFDISAAFGQAEIEGAPRRAIVPGTGGTLVVHHNAPFLPHALWALGRARVRGRRVIGYWAWEFPRIPDSWLPSLRYLHEIWVPSELARVAVASATELPVRVVPHPLPPAHPTPNMRARLGLPADALIVLTAFHMGSAFTRKNPLAAIAAFRRAFGDAPDRLLAIKLIDHGASPIAREELERAIGGAPNIRLINIMLPPADMSGLLAAVDIVLSLHRSEGFGLVPAEAMQLGKPVVATAWSGNMDFMNERNSAPVSYDLVPVQDPYDGAFIADGQLWAEAHVDDAAEWLRRLAADPALRQRLGDTARADIARQLSPTTIAQRIATLVEGGQAA
ncbi:MAG TPA: glycosyltransferase family 4 protein [Xanthobacteraceae bacterium]|nr:glycosyltransferase family 4 protein [Xanthobacteraceae bacterium]